MTEASKTWEVIQGARVGMYLTVSLESNDLREKRLEEN